MIICQIERKIKMNKKRVIRVESNDIEDLQSRDKKLKNLQNKKNKLDSKLDEFSQPVLSLKTKDIRPHA